jgi:hypothetical protein
MLAKRTGLRAYNLMRDEKRLRRDEVGESVFRAKKRVRYVPGTNGTFCYSRALQRVLACRRCLGVASEIIAEQRELPG